MKWISFRKLRGLSILFLCLISMLILSQAVSAGTPGYEPVFSISALWISPTQVNPGQTVNISAIVRESQNVSGIYEAVLTINDKVEETKKYLVAPLGSESIVFNVSKKDAGIYSIDLNGLKGSFTVGSTTTTAKTTTTSGVTTSKPTNGSSGSSFPVVPIIIGIVAVLIILGLLVYFMNKKKAV
jgi:cobalamin biosynthesis Mg chelatase CobN